MPSAFPLRLNPLGQSYYEASPIMHAAPPWCIATASSARRAHIGSSDRNRRTILPRRWAGSRALSLGRRHAPVGPAVNGQCHTSFSAAVANTVPDGMSTISRPARNCATTRVQPSGIRNGAGYIGACRGRTRLSADGADRGNFCHISADYQDSYYLAPSSMAAPCHELNIMQIIQP